MHYPLMESSTSESVDRQILTSDINNSQQNTSEVNSIKIEDNFPAVVLNDRTSRVLDGLLPDDVFFFCEGDLPRATKPDGYVLRRNDCVSKNIPYEKNVSKSVYE